MSSNWLEDPVYPSSHYSDKRLLWIVTGLMLIACHAVLAWMSTCFGYALPLSERPILSMVVTEMCAAAVFLIAVWGARMEGSGSLLVAPWIIFVGIVLRATMFVSTPMQEDDFYRYFWDGAVFGKWRQCFSI